jgi:heme exporter protein B
MNLRHIFTLIKKDVLLEVRQQYTLYGIVLYVLSTIFVIYLAAGQPEGVTWNMLFWITQLFICINAVAKSFLQESRGRMLYFYSVAGPADFIIAKLIFNVLLMLVMSLISLLLFLLLLGNPLVKALEFTALTCLGGTGLSLIFTFLAAIAAKAQQQTALMAILGFPLIIPQVLLLMKASITSFEQVLTTNWWSYIVLVAALDVMIIILSVILFPFLWKD